MTKWAYTFTNDESILFPPISVPDLRTGIGHGHFRPFNQEKPKKDKLRKAQKKRKIAKKSKRR